MKNFPDVSIRNEKVPFSTSWNEIAHYLLNVLSYLLYTNMMRVGQCALFAFLQCFQCTVCRMKSAMCRGQLTSIGIEGRGHCVVCSSSVQRWCALSVQRLSALWSVQCAVFSVLCIVQCAKFIVQRAVCGGQCLVVSVECAMGSACNDNVPYEVCSVHSAPPHSFLLFAFPIILCRV